jgi:hypothetical protein
MDVEKSKRCKWPGTDQTPAEVKQYILRYLTLLMLFRIRKNCLIGEGAIGFLRRALLVVVSYLM